MLTIKGSSFQAGLTVSSSDPQLTFDTPSVTAGQITVNVHAAASDQGTTSALTVTNPDGGTVTSPGSLHVT